MRDYSFQDMLAFSWGYADSEDIEHILCNNIPAAIIATRAQVQEDKQGIDYWVYRGNNQRPLSVDVKRRQDDPIISFNADDLALEIWNVVETRKIGWTLDKNKKSDYILWFFVPTKRWVLIPFPMLSHVFEKNLEKWQGKYRTATQSSNGGHWHSKCVFVPRLEIWRTIYDTYGGLPRSA